MVIKDSAQVTAATPATEDLFHSVLDSETFKTAPVMRTLLLYLWQHRGQSISEYAIAVEALGRPSDFDPKADATVRVQVARLRNKLKEFYERELPLFPLRLSIPLGSHEIEWVRDVGVAPVRRSGFRQLPPLYRQILIGVGIACALLAVVSMALAIQNRSLKESLPGAQAQPRFWRVFLADGKGVTIVLPNPLFFRWSSNPNILVRDVDVSEFQDWEHSSFLRDLSEKWGPPTLNQIYIPGLQMKAAVKLLQYIEGFGRHPNITDSPNLPVDSVGAQNTIFFGIPRFYATSHRVNQILEKMSFYVTGYEPTVIKNRNPRSGEAGEYREVDYSAEHRVYPQLIILLPPVANRARTLLLLGSNAMAATSILTSPDGLKTLDTFWSQNGSPESWEMLIHAEVNGETPLRVTPVAIHSIAKTLWN